MAQHHPAPNAPSEQVLLPMLPAAIVGIAALVGSLVLGFTLQDHLRYFFHAYLVSFLYFMSLAIGALFFVLIHHLTRAGWSVVIRRLAEAMTANFWLLAVLAIPLLTLGTHQIYTWMDPHSIPHSVVTEELHHLLHKKAAYLNEGFFVIRIAAYFLVFLGLSHFFRSRSLQQDQSGDPQLTLRMQAMSAPGIILFAVATTFLAFDMIMSLDPAWFSTIYGVYYFAGCALGFFAFVSLLAIWLQNSGHAREAIHSEHYHDLGKFSFAFVFFWSYIAFSQYMLIWYANLPEETCWYARRQVKPWLTVSLMLVALHFVIPFLGLLSRHVKRKNAVLAFWAVWLLLAHYLDLFYQIMPATWINAATLSKEQLPLMVGPYSENPAYTALVNQSVQPTVLVMCLLCFVGMGGLFVAVTLKALSGKALIPTRDPRLSESLAFENI